MYCFFFFKQKTAYEMRISDWSSDVCSSDLFCSQLFVLNHIARIDAMAAHERFAAATPDTVEAIVAGIGDFAAEVYAPLNRAGDTNNPKWNDGRVTMPSGFKEAYRQFVAAGWGSIDGPGAYGGQDLPFTDRK